MESRRLIENRGAKIALSQAGGGGAPPIFFTECAAQSQLARTLPFSYTKIDLRGQGESVIDERATKELSLEHYISDFDATLGRRAGKDARAKSEKVAFIAYSQAAYFVTQYAALRPEAFSKLVLIEPALYTEREELLKRAEIADRGDADGAIAAMLRYVDPATGLDLERKDSEVKNLASALQSPEVIASMYRIRANNPITSRHTRKLRMPVLLIAGTNSHVKDMVARAASEIEDASVWYVEGATHLDILDGKYAEKLSSVIQTFLAS